MTTRAIEFDSDLDYAIRATVTGLLDEWNLPELAGPVEIRKMSGGASNVNLQVLANGAVWALRVCAPDAARWGVIRAAAIQAQRDAAVLGLAPDIIATHLPDGHFLSEFVDGRTVTSEFVREGQLLPRIAGALRALKLGSTTSRDFSPFDDLRTFLELGDAEGADVADELSEFLAAALRIEALFETRDAPRGFCHSDLVPQNFIDLGDSLKMVDFDYAGNGWVSFELGSFACQAELTDDETREFLGAYDPEFDAAQLARVELMRAIAGVREALWCFMAEPILASSTKPLDGWTYASHASRNLAQARKVMGPDRLSTYLTEARYVRPGALF